MAKCTSCVDLGLEELSPCTENSDTVCTQCEPPFFGTGKAATGPNGELENAEESEECDDQINLNNSLISALVGALVGGIAALLVTFRQAWMSGLALVTSRLALVCKREQKTYPEHDVRRAPDNPRETRTTLFDVLLSPFAYIVRVVQACFGERGRRTYPEFNDVASPVKPRPRGQKTHPEFDAGTPGKPRRLSPPPVDVKTPDKRGQKTYPEFDVATPDKRSRFSPPPADIGNPDNVRYYKKPPPLDMFVSPKSSRDPRVLSPLNFLSP